MLFLMIFTAYIYESESELEKSKILSFFTLVKVVDIRLKIIYLYLY